MDKDDTPFSYTEAFGLHVNKVRFTNTIFDGRQGNFHYLTAEQKREIRYHEEAGYEIINGFQCTGKDFANHTGKMSEAPHLERDIPLLHRRGHGCWAIYPSGSREHHSSKSWKPGIEHFRK